MNMLRVSLPTLRTSAFETPRTITLDARSAILGLLGVYLLSVVMMVLSRALPSVLTVPFVVISLSFVPGALLLLSLAREETAAEASHVLYAFGASLAILMLVGTMVNILLPMAGVEKPLMAVPLGAGVSLTVGLLAVVAQWRNPSGTIRLQILPLWSPQFFALLLLPLLSIIGVTLLNATGINALVIAVLLSIGAVPIVAVRRLHARWHSLAIWTTSLAILYHKSLWQYAGFGGRPHGITAWEAGRWSPGVVTIEPYSSELVQNGVLFPLYARLSDLFIMTQYEVVNPFFVSFIPLALYVAFRRYVDSNVAFLGAATFAFAHPFYYQYPTAGRAATPVLFLALFGVALSNQRLPSGSRAALALTFLAGVVVTHYGTSYYVAAAFCLALVILTTLRFLDDVVENGLRRVATVSNSRKPIRGRAKIFSLSMVLFFVSAALGWYIYTRRGWKFELLPKHVHDNLLTLIRGSPTGGRTAARIHESYSSPSIQISKYLYILLAALILIGLATVAYRRLVTRDCSFDDPYLAIAASLFAIFGTTVILSNWGGGRPMMITFSFTTVFAVIGAAWLATTTNRAAGAVREALPNRLDLAEKIPGPPRTEASRGIDAFVGLLFVFLLLNTGVVAATAFDGLAPSNVPAQGELAKSEAPESQVTVHRNIDVVSHVWLVQHLQPGVPVYADTFGARQFDWFRPDIAARTTAVGGGYTAETKPTVLNAPRQRAGTQPGYVLIMGHNVELDAVWKSKFEPSVSLEAICIDRRNRIYTTGETQIYFYDTPSTSPRSTDVMNESCGGSA